MLSAELDLRQPILLDHFEADNNIFAIDRGRQIGGAGDAFFRTSTLRSLVDGHTVLGNSRNSFVEKINEQYGGLMKPYMPWNPPAAVIITGKDGRNAQLEVERGTVNIGQHLVTTCITSGQRTYQ